jgi:Methyltransferase domain
MLPHWHTVIRPFLEAADPGPIVEIGAYQGETTSLLGELAIERDVTLHVIDPMPEVDMEAMKRRFGRHFQFHREKSHDALETLEPASAVLIDGDHNWYTVYGELTRLARLAAADGLPLPLVMLHDMEWPYARRDMYYDPDSIPEEWIQPWDRRGIKWGGRLLDETGRGVNQSYAQAIEEGGPRNGVRTAVEDFIEQFVAPLELRIVNGYHGLGVLVPSDALAKNPAIRQCWDYLASVEFLSMQAREQSGLAAMESAARMEVTYERERLERELETQGKLSSVEHGSPG